MIALRVESGLQAAAALTTIKLIATRFPGQHRLRLQIGERRSLTLGPEWLYDASPACLAALGEFGQVEPARC